MLNDSCTAKVCPCGSGMLCYAGVNRTFTKASTFRKRNTEIPLPSNGSLARPALPPSHSVALLPPRGGHCLRSAVILLYTWCFTAGKTLRTSPRDGLGRPLSRSCVKHPAIPKRSHADKFQVFTERNKNRGPEASSL